MKKIIFIIMVVCLLCLFCLTSYAQSFTGDVNQLANDNRLWTPERITYLQSTIDGNTISTGTVFEVSPRYALDPSYLPQTTYVNVSSGNTLINNTVPMWLRYLYHNISYVEAVDATTGNSVLVKEYLQRIYLSRRGNEQTTDIVYLQADIPRFFVDLSSYNPTNFSDTSFTIKGIPTQKAFPCGFTVEYAVDNGVGVEFKTLSFSETSQGSEYIFSLENIIAKIEDKMEQEGDSFYYYGNNKILINKLSFSGYSEDGYCVIRQNIDGGVSMVGNANLSTDEVTPNFLNSMASVITDFFGTTLFEVGSYKVTLGVVFALPFVICILFVFLRKFAGG